MAQAVMNEIERCQLSKTAILKTQIEAALRGVHDPTQDIPPWERERNFEVVPVNAHLAKIARIAEALGMDQARYENIMSTAIYSPSGFIRSNNFQGLLFVEVDGMPLYLQISKEGLFLLPAWCKTKCTCQDSVCDYCKDGIYHPLTRKARKKEWLTGHTKWKHFKFER
jgi:hypothetical protein